MSDRYELENALLRVEQMAREVLVHAIDTEDGQRLRDALRKLDELRSAIRARQKLRAGAGL